MTTPAFDAMRSQLGLPLLAAAILWIGIASVPARAADAIAPARAMRMYRDPETGAIGRPSAAALRAEAGAAAVTAPVPSLVEEAVPGPAGGVRVNLRGSHRPAVVRFADPTGAVVHECVDSAGPAHE